MIEFFQRWPMTSNPHYLSCFLPQPSYPCFFNSLMNISRGNFCLYFFASEYYEYFLDTLFRPARVTDYNCWYTWCSHYIKIYKSFTHDNYPCRSQTTTDYESWANDEWFTTTVPARNVSIRGLSCYFGSALLMIRAGMSPIPQRSNHIRLSLDLPIKDQNHQNASV